jgi:hypothetical protein
MHSLLCSRFPRRFRSHLASLSLHPSGARGSESCLTHRATPCLHSAHASSSSSITNSITAQQSGGSDRQHAVACWSPHRVRRGGGTTQTLGLLYMATEILPEASRYRTLWIVRLIVIMLWSAVLYIGDQFTDRKASWPLIIFFAAFSEWLTVNYLTKRDFYPWDMFVDTWFPGRETRSNKVAWGGCMVSAGGNGALCDSCTMKESRPNHWLQATQKSASPSLFLLAAGAAPLCAPEPSRSASDNRDRRE